MTLPLPGFQYPLVVSLAVIGVANLIGFFFTGSYLFMYCTAGALFHNSSVIDLFALALQPFSILTA